MTKKTDKTLSQRMLETARNIDGKNYIGIVNGNTVTAVEVLEVLNDGFVATVVGDTSGMAITYPMIPFTVVNEEFAKVIKEKLAELKNGGNVVKGNFSKPN